MTACRELHATWSFPVGDMTSDGLIDRDIALTLRRERKYATNYVKEDST